MSKMTLSGVLAGLVLMTISTLAALLAAEAITRLVLPQDMGSIVNIYVQDEALQYRYQPDARARQKSPEYDVEIVTSSLGFRDGEYSAAKPPGVCRALLVGDSFSVGHGVPVDAGYAERLEQGLNAAVTGAAQPWEIVNASVSGYHLYHYMKSIEIYARRFDVDLVIVGFFVGNDFGGHDASARREIRNGFLGRYERGIRDVEQVGLGVRVRRWLTPVREWLATRSHLYVLLVRSTFPALARLGLVDPDNAAGLDRYALEPNPRVEAWFAATDDLLARTKTAAGDAGADLLFVVVPEPFQIDAAAWDRAVAQSGRGAATVAPDAPNLRLRQMLERHAIDYLDLYSVLRDGRGVAAYFPRDGHWNEVGHDAAARALLPIVAARAGAHCGAGSGEQA